MHGGLNRVICSNSIRQPTEKHVSRARPQEAREVITPESMCNLRNGKPTWKEPIRRQSFQRCSRMCMYKPATMAAGASVGAWPIAHSAWSSLPGQMYTGERTELCRAAGLAEVPVVPRGQGVLESRRHVRPSIAACGIRRSCLRRKRRGLRHVSPASWAFPLSPGGAEGQVHRAAPAGGTKNGRNTNACFYSPPIAACAQ